MTALHDYLRAAAAVPFVWGRSDCAHFAEAWAILRTGLAFSFPRPKSASGYARLTRRCGLAELATAAWLKAGLAVGLIAREGDIGVVRTADGDVLAIRVADAWAVKAQAGGVCLIDAEPVAVLVVPECHP